MDPWLECVPSYLCWLLEAISLNGSGAVTWLIIKQQTKIIKMPKQKNIIVIKNSDNNHENNHYNV